MQNQTSFLITISHQRQQKRQRTEVKKLIFNWLRYQNEKQNQQIRYICLASNKYLPHHMSVLNKTQKRRSDDKIANGETYWFCLFFFFSFLFMKIWFVDWIVIERKIKFRKPQSAFSRIGNHKYTLLRIIR